MRAAQGGQWPADRHWSKTLPPWFVQTFAAEQSPEAEAEWLARWRELGPDARAQAARGRDWTLPDWLHWMKPTERQWYWWDAEFEGRYEARILVNVGGWPVAVGALEKLLRSAGADSVDVIEDLVL